MTPTGNAVSVPYMQDKDEEKKKSPVQEKVEIARETMAQAREVIKVSRQKLTAELDRRKRKPEQKPPVAVVVVDS